MKRDNKNKLTKILLIIYIIALFWIIIFKFNISFPNFGYTRSINLIPFNASSIINNQLDYSELVMNIVIFIPLGIYLGVLLNRWSVIRKFLFVFFISFLCEIMQFILGVGAFDITDIINNVLGGVIGLIIYKVIKKILNHNAQSFINIIAIIGTILMSGLLLILIIYNL